MSVRNPCRLIDLYLVLKEICAQHELCALGISSMLMSMEAPRLPFAVLSPTILGQCQEKAGALVMMLMMTIKIMTPFLNTCFSLNEEDRRQEFHKISKEEFRPDAGYGKQDSFIASGTHFTCPSWIIYWLLCPTDQNIEGASRLLGTGRLEPGFWPEDFRTSFLFPSSFFLCLLISFSHTILLHKV